jgi:hypothetical protein
MNFHVLAHIMQTSAPKIWRQSTHTNRFNKTVRLSFFLCDAALVACGLLEFSSRWSLWAGFLDCLCTLLIIFSKTIYIFRISIAEKGAILLVLTTITFSRNTLNCGLVTMKFRIQGDICSAWSTLADERWNRRSTRYILSKHKNFLSREGGLQKFGPMSSKGLRPPWLQHLGLKLHDNLYRETDFFEL